MSSVAVVWLVVGLISAVAVLAVLIALVRHVMVLFRALGRFRSEVSPIAGEIAALGERAAATSRRAANDRPFGRGDGRTVR